jgi:hypothetical protein
MPILGPQGEQASEPELGAFGFVYIDHGEVTEAGGRDVEAETERGIFEF